MASNTKPTKLYSMKEVKENNGNSAEGHNVWIVIHNSVYNVTEFLNEHPGGEEVLLEQGGKDATEAFEDVGHSSDARDMMANYKIGELVEADRKKPSDDKKPTDWVPETTGDRLDFRVLICFIVLIGIILIGLIIFGFDSGSWKSWLVPIALGVLATIIYRFFFNQ